MKFAFQILQKWAEKRGRLCLGCLEGFVFVLMFEFSVVTIRIHHLSCNSRIKNKCPNISWTCSGAESTYKLQNLETLCRVRGMMVHSLLYVHLELYPFHWLDDPLWPTAQYVISLKNKTISRERGLCSKDFPTTFPFSIYNACYE